YTFNKQPHNYPGRRSHMKRCWIKFMALATFLIASSLTVFGQSGTAPLSGLVLDPNGSAVHGANVVVKNDATGAETTTTTTSTGTYTVPSLGAGSYSVTIEAPDSRRPSYRA